MATAYGRIDGFSAYMIGDDGTVVNVITGDVLRGSLKHTGYVEMCLKDDDGKAHYMLLHRLVAAAFCARESDAQEVNHIDGDKTNNRAVNLEWISHADNLRHAYEAGLREDDVSPRAVIATNMETGEETAFASIYKAARFLGISQGNICMACKGQRPHAGGYRWRYAG